MQWRGCEGSDRPSGYDKGDPEYRLLPKSRNGFSAETVCGEIGDVILVISHDRWRSAPNTAVRISADLSRSLSAIEFTCKSSPPVLSTGSVLPVLLCDPSTRPR
jgi:hypothetical protein